MEAALKKNLRRPTKAPARSRAQIRADSDRGEASGDSARERILKAALSDFAARGFDGVSVTDVARTAGVTQPLIHYHFAGKEELWRAAVDRAFSDLRAAFATAVDEFHRLDPEQALGLLIRRFVLFSGQHREVSLIMTREGFEPGPRLDWILQNHFKPLQALIEPLATSGIQRGKLKDMPFANVAQVLIGAVSSFFGSAPLLQQLHGIDPLSPEEIRRHADVVEEVLLHGVVVARESNPPRAGMPAKGKK